MIVAIGYFASLLLAFSLLVTNTIKFRWLSTGGQVSFITYGILIGATPIIIANSVLLCINIYQLIKLYRYEETFHLVPIKTGDMLIGKFLSFYQKDIRNYFPDFAFLSDDHKTCFVVLRDLVVSNIFVATLTAEGNAIVEINYTVPNYRDYKVGRFIFDKEKEYLVAQGVKQIVYEKVFNKSHQQFLKAMGFVEQEVNGKACIVKKLL